MSAPYSLTERLAIHPLLQAPMAGVSTPALAAAVSNARGLGAIGIGASTLDQARQMIRDTRALTSRPFNVNVFCHKPARRDPAAEDAWLRHLAPLFAELDIPLPGQLNEIYPSFLSEPAIFNLLMDERPGVVSFHFGLPGVAQVLALQSAGIFTLATVTSLEEARLAERIGIDGLVAQGIEAGGHRGIFNPLGTDERLPTLALVKQLKDRVNRPLIAAGGIMTGQHIQQALDAGAVAAQLGTAFLLCPESATSANWRANLKSERAAHTRLTSVLSGRPARGLTNRLMDWGEMPDSPSPADYPLAYDVAKQLHGAAQRHNNHEFAAQWAGQAASLAREYPAAELVNLLVNEWQRAR